MVAAEKNIAYRVHPKRHRISVRYGVYSIVFAILVSLGPALPLVSKGQELPLCFNVPGIRDCIEGRFLEYWAQNGGLPVFGYPITPARREANRDTGQTYLTQWFERNRFELHPENSQPYDVLLGRLGDDRLLQIRRMWQSEPREAGPKAGCLWFAETGHNVCDQLSQLGFKTYWQSNGLRDGRLNPYGRSLALFGLPLTEPRLEANPDGDTVFTQWFERARFEWHPNQSDQFKVLLGRLGDEITKVTIPGPTPQPTSPTNPTTTLPTPTPLPSPTPTPSTLPYVADWSNGLNGWSVTKDWKTVDGILVNDGTGSNTGTGATAPIRLTGVRDYAVEAEMQFVRKGDDADCVPIYSIFVRAKDFPNEGYTAGQSAASCFYGDALGIYVGNSRDDLASKSFALDTDWHTFRLEVEGYNIRLFVDGSLQLETIDSRYLEGGQVGLWDRAVAVNVQSFKVLPLGVPPTTNPTQPPQTGTCTDLLEGGFGVIWRTNADVQTRLGCPVESAITGPSAEQTFERGIMYWWGTSQQIYVFAGEVNGNWSQYPDTYREGEELEPVQPPPGLYTPERGFGKVWRNNRDVRDALGWATRLEDGREGVSQRFERGTLLYSNQMNGHGEQIYVLFQDRSYKTFPEPPK